MNRESDSTGTAALATGTDQVIDLAVRWNAAKLREDELERKEHEARVARDTSASHYFKSAANEAHAEIDALRGMIPFVKATSLSGAAIQIVEALNLVDLIHDQLPQEQNIAMVEREFRALNRLLYSALSIIDDFADRKLDDVAAFLLQPQLDPWTPVEDRLTIVRADADDRLVEAGAVIGARR